jgi:hypothetical protein
MSWGFEVVCKDKADAKLAIDKHANEMPDYIVAALKKAVDNFNAQGDEPGTHYILESAGHIESVTDNVNFTYFSCKVRPINTTGTKFYLAK